MTEKIRTFKFHAMSMNYVELLWRLASWERSERKCLSNIWAYPSELKVWISTVTSCGARVINSFVHIILDSSNRFSIESNVVNVVKPQSEDKLTKKRDSQCMHYLSWARLNFKRMHANLSKSKNDNKHWSQF